MTGEFMRSIFNHIFSPKYILPFVLACGALSGYAQKRVIISGIIVDSVSLVALPNAYIKLKSSGTGAVAGAGGAFKLSAPVFDTLIFSCIGYTPIEYPVLLSEEDVLIRLQESVILLPEITTVGTRLSETKYEERRPVHMPAQGLLEGIGSPFTYFSKTEKEKRKLMKVRQENSKIRTFVEVVNDPDLKKDMMNEFSISETEYYALLAKFNQENKYVHYMVDEEQIREVLFTFFKKELSADKK